MNRKIGLMLIGCFMMASLLVACQLELPEVIELQPGLGENLESMSNM